MRDRVRRWVRCRLRGLCVAVVRAGEVETVAHLELMHLQDVSRLRRDAALCDEPTRVAVERYISGTVNPQFEAMMIRLGYR